MHDVMSRLKLVVEEFITRAYMCIFSHDSPVNIDGLISSAHTYLKCAELVLADIPEVIPLLSNHAIDTLLKLATLRYEETRFAKLQNVDHDLVQKKLVKVVQRARLILRKIDKARKSIRGAPTH